MKFLVDNQLPPALARFISDDLHVEALHVVDAGLRDAKVPALVGGGETRGNMPASGDCEVRVCVAGVLDYCRDMSVDAIKEAIAALPLEERHALATWLNELEYDA